MTLRQCGISVFVLQTSFSQIFTNFHKETSGDVGKCWLLSHAINLDTGAIFTDYMAESCISEPTLLFLNLTLEKQRSKFKR